MRVALLTLYPSDTDIIPGGIRMVSYNLVQGLLAYPDLDLQVVHCHSDIEIEKERIVTDGRVTVHYLAMSRKRIVPNLLISVRRVTERLRQLAPDLVHAHVAHFAYAAARAGYPTVFTVHGVLARERKIYTDTLFDRLRYGLLAWYESRALECVDSAVAISPYVMREYGRRGAVPWRRIDNPVPQRFFDLEDRAQSGSVLYAGSITEIKDLLTLLRAMVSLRKRYAQARLRIAGRVTSEAYALRVKEYVETHDLQDTVQFLGLLGREELEREYERCTVLALPSLQENAPMAVIEAMAAGKPVVASHVGGLPNLVQDGETGFLVPARDAEAFAERLGQVLQDVALARRLGRRGREVARQRFAVERVARAYYDLYSDVLGKG